MKRVTNVLLLIAIFLSFSLLHWANAKDHRMGAKEIQKQIKKEIKSKLEGITSENKTAKDCKALYILREDGIGKYSLPDLNLVLSIRPLSKLN